MSNTDQADFTTAVEDTILWGVLPILGERKKQKKAETLQVRRNPKMALRRDGKDLIVLPTMVRKRASAYRP